MPPDVQIALVSDQPTPNMTPVVDPEFRPRELVLVVSPDKHRQAQWLADALHGTGVRISHWPIDDAWNIEHIRDRLLDLLAEREGQTIALNATGGTKPMAIAAYEVFRSQDIPIFYVHPENDHLVWLHHPDRLPSRDLAHRVELRQFLLAHGTRIVGQGSELGVPENQRRLAAALIQDIEDYARALGQLNRAAAQAEGGLLSEPVREGMPAWKILIGLFEKAGILQQRGDRLSFPDEASRFYANGGWLENHVYGLCLNLKTNLGVRDIARSLQVERRSGCEVIRNELDVALLFNNRLHVVECKTCRFDEVANGKAKGTDALYKLDSLTDLLGGLKARAMLVSYRPLGVHDQQRARDLRIEVCQGADLKQLPERLRQWIAPPSIPMQLN